MKKLVQGMLLLALLAALSALPAAAQTTGIKGVAKDTEGKFITDGVVQITNTETQRKTEAKTNKNGEYINIGLSPGNYDVVLTRNGVAVDGFNKVPLAMGQTIDVNFDLKKDLAGKGPSEEQIKKQQEVTKQNEKIKGLNAKLGEVRDLEKAGNYDQAITVMQEVTQADPTKDILWAYLGEAYSKAKKYPEAIEAYEKAIAIKSDATKGEAAKGDASKGDTAKRDMVLYLNSLADAYNKSGKGDKAIAEYTQVAQIDPASAPTAYFNMGVVYYNGNKADDAVAAFDKSLELDPNRADAYYYKGMALLNKATLSKDGKYSPAPGTVEAFQKYLELKPDGANAQTAKDTLAMLGSSVETTYGKQKAPSKKKP
jgi:tetratricopeptide (TPR) repeat protein